MLCSEQNIRKFSEAEAKFHMAPPWDRRKDGKLIPMTKVISCYSLHHRGGAFSRDFTTNLAPQRRALKIGKLKAPLFPGPEGGDTNDWCISDMADHYKSVLWITITFHLPN